MYSQKVKEIRRCKAFRQDGKPCQAFALWDSHKGFCASHTYKKKPKHPVGFKPKDIKKRLSCTCNAYPFLHRPGGGKCLWNGDINLLIERKKLKRSS